MSGLGDLPGDGGLFDDDGGDTGPTHWPTLPSRVAEGAWTQLREWVEQLVDRFALDTRTVPPCWFRHNGIVEVLSALRDHEQACFAPDAPSSAGIDWFRALREAEYRLVDCAGRTQCSALEHRPDPNRVWRVDEGAWGAFVAADVAARDQAAIHAGLHGR